MKERRLMLSKEQRYQLTLININWSNTNERTIDEISLEKNIIVNQ